MVEAIKNNSENSFLNEINNKDAESIKSLVNKQLDDLKKQLDD
jgi:hypothetical protein